jgi:spore germination protein GerM
MYIDSPFGTRLERFRAMNRFSQNRSALLMVAIILLGGCTGRTILHGMQGYHHLKVALPAAMPVPPTVNRLCIWFVKSSSGEGLKIVPVVRGPSGGDRLEQALHELLDGPSAAEERNGLGTEIPRGTILLSIKHSGHDIEVNLSRRFALDGGTTSFETRLEQLRKTVAQVAGQADVYLSVEGKRLNMEEGEGIEIHQPINR